MRAVAGLGLLALTACRPDDFLVGDSGEARDTASEAGDTGDEDALHGDWLSAGEDVSPVLSEYYDITRIEVMFSADGSYATTMLDGSGGSYAAEGVFTTSGPGTIRGIVLSQASPDEAAYEGIFAVEDEVLTYEVAQVDPPIAGVSAPTVEEGFGSTGGVDEGDNVQTYRRP